VDDRDDFLPRRDPLPQSDRNWSNIATWAVAAIAIAVFLSAGGAWLASRPVPRGVEVLIPAESAAHPATVHVTGGVTNPGVYALSPDARILDAIESASGLINPELSHGLNLAQVVADGQQINISDGGGLTLIGGVASGRSQDGRIDLNTANASLL